MKAFKLTIVLMLIAALLPGCSKHIRSDVSVFHRILEASTPTTYVCIPLEGQENDLEYLTYQDLIRKQLVEHQYREVNINENPDVAIAYLYGVDNGTQKLSSIPVFGKTGIASSDTFGTINIYGNSGTFSGITTYTPTYGIKGYQTYSTTDYRRGFFLYIVDARSFGGEKLNVLYQGSAISEGRSANLSQVMPAMIKALFREFPGVSGETRRESIPME
jgi:hypothetical protein